MTRWLRNFTPSTVCACWPMPLPFFYALWGVDQTAGSKLHEETRQSSFVSSAASVPALNQQHSQNVQEESHQVTRHRPWNQTRKMLHRQHTQRKEEENYQWEFSSLMNVSRNSSQKTLSEQHKHNTDIKNPRDKLTSSRTKNQTASSTPWRHAQGEKGHSYDDYKVDLSLDEVPHFPLHVDTCSGRGNIIRASSGVIYLTSNKTTPQIFECRWKIHVAKDRFIAARIQYIGQYNRNYARIYVEDCFSWTDIGLCSVNRLFYTRDSAIFHVQVESPRNVTVFYLFFTTVTRDGNLFLPAVMTSSTTGYVTSVGFGGKAHYSRCANARHDLIVPRDHLVMISFPHVDLDTSFSSADSLSFYATSNNRSAVMRVCGGGSYRPQLFNTSLVVVMVTDSEMGGSGFKVDFSFHPVSIATLRYEDVSWNCSGPYYPAFKQHVHCDLTRDCAGGEDEGQGAQCPFSSPLCNGSLAVGNKCYASFRTEKPVTWHDADRACRTHGGILAVMREVGEREALWEIFRYSRWWSPAYVGLKRSNVRFLYLQYPWIWSDDITAFGPNISYSDRNRFTKPVCAYMTSSRLDATSICENERPEKYLGAVLCSSEEFNHYFCEFAAVKPPSRTEGSASNARPLDLAHDIDRLWSQHAVTQCPSGHMTFSFLSCEPSSDCGTQQQQASCTTHFLVKPRVADQDKLQSYVFQTDDKTRVPATNGTFLPISTPPTNDVPTPSSHAVTVFMFSCADSALTLPYSLVCDYTAHCPGGSDETFCTHAKCPEYTCRSGQCFSFDQRCDFMIRYDCLDKSDEENCRRDDRPGYRYDSMQPPPTVVHFHLYVNKYKRRPGLCPETHFLCSGAESYCLPVFLRCNGLNDCPGREDEDRCDHYRCPGFYRCRESKICVHSDHMCDDFPHCPQRDDDFYCGLTCPAGCLCQGRAVVCTKKFPAHEHLEIRYLDASGSHMKPTDLLNNTYLIWLSLASCGIGQVSDLMWKNIIRLDLSQNNMRVVNMTHFYNLANLRTLILANNPLVSLIQNAVCFPHRVLNSIDISKTLLREFDTNAFSCYQYISKLNISNCPLDNIKDTGFKFTPYLTSVDLSGSPVSNFPRSIFKSLNHLDSVFATNYKLCCTATLPDNFNENNCFAPQDEISSCDDLLKSNLFRGCMWVFASLTVLGNLSSFFIKFVFRGKNPQSGFSVFVINLTVSDFLMGVYLMIVGVADLVYRGQYMWHDSQWKTSKACAVAGFMSLLSSEMSAFVICLITLDRFIVLTFPFTDFRFKGRSAAITCGLLWTVGSILATVPLFPMTPRWEFYGQTGICIPLPITRERFRGHSYSFGVMIVLNFTLFLLIAAGQVSIYWSVRANSIKASSSRKPQDLAIARRLFSVAASDFLCWFPIGFLAVLSARGVQVSADVNVAMAIFVLPVNSAMNPFLYTFNVFVEKRRKVRETQLMKILETRLLSQNKSVVPETKMGQ